ncbi:cytochrome P450 [Mycobacterium palustre]|nr:cytochrome P450 [Mycobacterium palustre]MCV7100429.1 cytochrome P450 [Mycobacterium palustre]
MASDFDVVPGTAPSKCPIAAATYDPMDPEHLANPDAVFRTLAEDNPVQFIPALQMYFVLTEDLCREVLRDTDTYTSRLANNPGEVPDEVKPRLPEGYPHSFPGLINNDPPAHDEHRYYIKRLFTPKTVLQYQPIMEALTTELIDGFISDGHVDFVGQFAVPLPIRVITTILGAHDLDIDTVRRWTESAFGLVDPNLEHSVRVGMANDIADLNDYAQALIDSRRASPTDDLMSTLVHLKTDEGEYAYNDPELRHHFLILLGAGNATTTTLLGNLVFHLLRDRTNWERFVADRSLADSAIEETLRIKAPAKIAFRNATRDVELSGVSIPQGAFVCPALTQANMSDEKWPNPTEFQIDRPNAREHYAFGKFAHFCLGAPVSRLEAKLVLNKLADRLPGLRLAKDFIPQYRPHILTQDLLELPLEWDL